MKIPVFIMIAASVAYLFSPNIFAENEGPPRGDRPGERPGAERPGGRPGGGGFSGRRPQNPVLLVLDKDRNGTLSSEEIAGASAALKTLDKNGDGQITREEFRPTQGGQGGGAPGGGGPGDFIARLMENDKNKDGKLSKEELPERMQRVLERADTSGDGALDKAELDAMAKRFTAGRGGQGGPGGERPGGGRPGGGPDGGDDRPKRPDFE
jgi:hypothetical protein